MIITIKGAEALINKKEIEAVKEKIEQYYYNEKVLAWNQKELERLTRRLQEIEQDRNSPLLPVSLDTDLQGVRYDRIGGKSGVVQSPIDRNIEAIYDRLDKNYEETQEKILDLKIKIAKQEDERKKVEFYIHFLSEENRKLLQYKFQNKKSVTEIAFLLHLSKSTVCRSFYEIYKWLYKIMEYDGAFEKT